MNRIFACMVTFLLFVSLPQSLYCDTSAPKLDAKLQKELMRRSELWNEAESLETELKKILDGKVINPNQLIPQAKRKQAQDIVIKLLPKYSELDALYDTSLKVQERPIYFAAAGMLAGGILAGVFTNYVLGFVVAKDSTTTKKLAKGTATIVVGLYGGEFCARMLKPSLLIDCDEFYIDHDKLEAIRARKKVLDSIDWDAR